MFCRSIYAQTFAFKKQTLQHVFDNVVAAYGNAKAAPQLLLLPNNQKERVVAAYTATPQPTIKVDEQLIDICLQLKADSLNALSTIISHELAHYYNDHTFCSDYAFALGNTTLSKALRSTNKANKLEKETEADYLGLWHATLAGYYPFNVFDRLIDRIYVSYHLPDAVNGYPSKAERKAINKERQEKVAMLVPVFNAGVVLNEIGQYEAAADCFNQVVQYFPSRESYNNVGVAQLMAALQLKPKQAVEFIYPIELDALSRLQNNTTRSISEEQQTKIESLLLSAKQNFEKSITLDAAYTKAFINLACVLDIMENPEGAVGKLNELPNALQINNVVNLIKGIAYYHADNTAKADFFFSKLILDVDSIIDFDSHLYRLSNSSIANITTFTNNYQKQQKQINVEIPDSLKTSIENLIIHSKTCQTITGLNKINICTNKLNTEMEINLGNKSIKAIKIANNALQTYTIKHGPYWFINNNWLIKEF